jgi:hypothetical protein
MDDRLRGQLEQLLVQAEVEERSEIFLRQALGIEVPVEDGAWIKSMFRLAAVFLELAYGSKKEANRVLPWLLFSLGAAYERYQIQGGEEMKGAKPLQHQGAGLTFNLHLQQARRVPLLKL